MGRPVKRRWRVCAGPRISTSFWPSANGTRRPMRASGMPKRAPSAATRRSQCSASSQPPAIASPCTMAMVGCRERSTRWSTCVTPLSGSPLGSSCRWRISRRSMPEQKPGPSPRTTTTRTSGFLSSASMCSTSPFSMARFIALRRSGRFMVKVATPSWMCSLSSSVMRRPLLFGAGGERGPLLPQTPPPTWIRRRRWLPTRLVSARGDWSSQKMSRDDHAVHFGGAFTDAAHAGLPVPALQREFLGDAVAAVDLDGGVDDATEHLARVQLGHRGFHARVLAAIGLPRPRPDDPAAGAELHLGVRQHPLDGLALGQGLAEGGALLGMRDGHAMRRHRHPEIAGGVGETVLHQEIEGEIEPLALGADERVARQHAVLEDHVVGPRGGADHLDLAGVKAGRAVLEDEAGD